MNEKNQLQIELSAEVAEGIYSNLAVISHSSSEFVVDFIRIMPGIPSPCKITNCTYSRTRKATDVRITREYYKI